MWTLKDSLIIEDKPEIFDFRFEFEGILMWPFIRRYLHLIPIIKEYELTGLYDILHFSQKKFDFIDKVPYLKNTIINHPYRKSKDYDILMFYSGITNVKKDGEYFNRLSDYFAFINRDRTLLIENSVRRRYYTPRSFPNVCYHDFIELVAYIKSKFVKPSKEDEATIKSLLRFLEQNFPYKLDRSELNTIEKSLFRISKRLDIYHHLYNRLFDRFNPKVIFLEDASYGIRSYIIKWAKSRGIVTIELQHGFVSENHAAYNYGKAILDSDIYKEYLPDYFLTYGRYWSEVINLPVEKIVIGNPNYSENIKKPKISDQHKTKILVVSTGVTPDKIKKLVLEVSNIIDSSKYEVSFRPHPTELTRLKDRYSELIAKDIKIDTEQDVYLSLLKADFVVGEYCTVLFEAIGICKSVFVIRDPVVDLHIPKDMIKRFSNAEELIDLIQTHTPNSKINRDYIWEPNWEVNYRNFIENLLAS
jgi:hypothetical protein